MITTNYIIDEDAGITTVEVALEDEIFAAGSAKCLPEDNFDPAIGFNLALGRALQNAGRDLERLAFDEVHEQDAVREARLEASKEATRRKQEASYQFKCEFAALINAVLAEKEGRRVKIVDWKYEGQDGATYNGRVGRVKKKTHPTSTYIRVVLDDNGEEVLFYEHEVQTIDSPVTDLGSTGQVVR